MTQALGTLKDGFDENWTLSLERKMGGTEFDNVRYITIAHNGDAPNHKDIKFTTIALCDLEKEAFEYTYHHDLQADIDRMTGEIRGIVTGKR